MHAVNEIISVLEKINITKELLETTRLGKHVNELRRKSRDAGLARRAKLLVKRWRDLVIPAPPSASAGTLNRGDHRSAALSRGTSPAVVRPGGTPLTSPAVARGTPLTSPALDRGTPLSSPALARGTPLSSPALFRGTPLTSPAVSQGTPLTSPALSRVPALTSPALSRVPALTSPALGRHTPIPATRSPQPPSRRAVTPTLVSPAPAYDSDSQDVILVDDDPEPVLVPAPTPLAVERRSESPMQVPDAKKAKRDKKTKKRSKNHDRESTWPERNGTSATGETPAARRNGCKRAARPALDNYSYLINKLPAAGTKKMKRQERQECWTPGSNRSPPKGIFDIICDAPSSDDEAPAMPGPSASAADDSASLFDDSSDSELDISDVGEDVTVKTTKELLVEIQARKSGAPPSPAAHGPALPRSPITIEDDILPPKTEPKSELQTPFVPSESILSRVPALPAVVDEPYAECSCEETPRASCAAARAPSLSGPRRLRTLHHRLVPGINGTLAPPLRAPAADLRPARDGALYHTVVPKYSFLDCADDYCVKDLSRVPLCPKYAWTPVPEVPDEPVKCKSEKSETETEMDVDGEGSPCPNGPKEPDVRLEGVDGSASVTCDGDVKHEHVCENGEADGVSCDAETEMDDVKRDVKTEVDDGGVGECGVDGRTLVAMSETALSAATLHYGLAGPPKVTPWAQAETESWEETPRDSRSPPPRSDSFSEWHEAAVLGDLLALPYVLID